MSCHALPAQPIRMLLVDDDARVRAAIIATVALEADLTLVSRRPGCAVVAMSVRSGLRPAALAAGAVAFAGKASGIDVILDAVRAAAPPQRT